MFGVTGTGLAAFKTWRNEGKRPRYSLDQWDRVCPPPFLLVHGSIADPLSSKVGQNIRSRPRPAKRQD
ncbi:hypothetical protein AAL_03358 [Moelleriella libera RCEF 2490]|uniref:Uncharacterized protein n=1 Tax=Moelleriella libera RCEF 2490 TaxID=1081109 RepID=A0A168D5Z3_9HYPO|nr:hypothetical protein AAL_03358 [Moelleriella libera RCEF 2490]